ncbi:uncharacterized protein EURHEDRAFT_409601 [Aspergillus ruber CBS 135680]|uniref:Uncharacterized protein n=1 Tax=Aspergillus ruber (strain CBS 135680) TaxID=1388766 RepID=A0A017SMS5_ASPRC|nr:uncharacterized protein EURHEDRAFT_409601 [Aspergillus ruber CBS 135680]EYE98267.1 hypothetical protein EURHEDRAFT_409601 [Aspergillus ruber CBS 135680]
MSLHGRLGLVGKILDLYIYSSASILVFVPVWWFFYFYFILHSGRVEEQVIPKDCEKKEKTYEGGGKKIDSRAVALCLLC